MVISLWRVVLRITDSKVFVALAFDLRQDIEDILLTLLHLWIIPIMDLNQIKGADQCMRLNFKLL